VEARFADEDAAFAILERKEAEPEITPKADLAQEADPGRLARQRLAADEAHDLRLDPHRRVGFEIVQAIGAQTQPRPLEEWSVGGGQALVQSLSPVESAAGG
jgi:hypothetical protein